MAWRERRKRTGDAEGFDLRMRAADRIGGPPHGGNRRRERAPRTARKARRGGKGGFRIGPLFYWAAVLALWAVIAVIGKFPNGRPRS
jgi:hypothetical protein